MPYLLAILCLTSPTKSIGIEPSDSLLLAPVLELLPKALPLPLQTPLSARCFDLEGKDLGVGAWLPKTLSDALDLQRESCKRLPQRCQSKLNIVWLDILPTTIAAVAKTSKADQVATAVRAEVDRPTGHSTWEVVGWSTAAGVGGIVLGIIIGGSAVLIMHSR